MANKCRFVLNISNGVVCGRNSVTDSNPIIYRKIDDETATAIVRKQVSVTEVIDAIDMQDRSVEGFNWRKYDAERREAEKKLNVSRREMIPVSDEQQTNETAAAEEADVVTLEGLGVRKGGKAAKSKAADNAAVTREKKAATKNAELPKAEVPHVEANI